MFSLVKFDNGEYSVLSTKRVKVIDGDKCNVRYIGGAIYSANILDTSDTESFLIDVKKKLVEESNVSSPGSNSSDQNAFSTQKTISDETSDDLIKAKFKKPRVFINPVIVDKKIKLSKQQSSNQRDVCTEDDIPSADVLNVPASHMNSTPINSPPTMANLEISRIFPHDCSIDSTPPETSVNVDTHSTDNVRDSTYNPLNSSNDISIEVPVKKKTHKKESPLKKTSVDIRKVRVPEAFDVNMKSKQHFCKFCKKLQTKFSRHLILKHKNEEEVKKFLFLPKGHRQRLKIIDTIRKKGDYLHNTEKDLNSGILILPRRRQNNSTNTSEDFTCCKLCKGFFPKQTIRFHVSNCQNDRNKAARDILISGRRVTGFIHSLANDLLRNTVFPVLRDDDVSRAIRYDELIIKFANKLTEKYTLKHQHDMIRAHLRLLGRLKLEIMTINDKIQEFQEIFKPQHFDLIIESIRAVANWDCTTMNYKTPAVATTLTTLINKCCRKFRSECIKNHDEESKKLAEDFLLLWQEDVPVMINKKAQDNLNDMKRLKKVVLPSKEDIKILYDYLNNECSSCLAILEDEFNFTAWKLLTQCTLISVQIFNRRRAGEIERLKTVNYEKKQDLTDYIDKELYNKLSTEAKQFAKRFLRLSIEGKKKRTVSVLLNPLAIKCIDKILEFRQQANVSSDNEYIFSVPGNNDSAKNYLRACPLMKKFAGECGAQMPSSLRGTNLRKHIATFTSLLNVEECQIDKLANFMGHAKDIHKNVYRVPVPISEITEVSKMLLNAIGGDEEEDDDDDPSDEESEQDNIDDDSSDDENIMPVEVTTDSVAENESSASNNSSFNVAERTKSKTFQNRKIIRKRWTREEKAVLLKNFGKFSKLQKLPTLVQCAALIKKYAVLEKRTPAQIKAFIQNQRGRVTYQ